jgi:uncharacterized protein
LGKLLFLVLLAALGIVVWKVMAATARRDASQRGSKDASKPHLREPETIVQCSQCELHLPRGEALLVDGRYFCSPEHERDYHARQSESR